jgi:hypothetical protein
VWRVSRLWSSRKGKIKLRVPQTRMLNRIFGPKREEVIREWKRLVRNKSTGMKVHKSSEIR